ncbi:putative PEP-binding protein, partial [Mesorhizobium sp. M8A.F.Ca.ET.182.01.1.1]
IVALAENNDPIIIDGDDGQVHLRPMSDLQRAYEEKVRLRARRQEQFRALRNVEPITKDGQKVNLKMNAGLLVDLPQLDESGADGIGLFRTELQFMIASNMP